ncbi:MAG: hypothetical protein WCG27_10860, partial [Pseudomonadota bacterium]
MFKSHERLFSLLQKALDLITVLICWMVAYKIRFHYLAGAQPGLELRFFNLSFVLMGLSLFFFYRNGLYRSLRFSSRLKEIGTVLTANLQSILSFILLLYFFAPERISRLTLGLYFITSIFALVAVRLCVRNFLRALRRRGY